jgi:hypothetical protein
VAYNAIREDEGRRRPGDGSGRRKEPLLRDPSRIMETHFVFHLEGEGAIFPSVSILTFEDTSIASFIYIFVFDFMRLFSLEKGLWLGLLCGLMVQTFCSAA